jgi:putative transposase
VPLADWPVERQADWLQWVNRPQTTAEEEAVRTSIRRGRPFGADAWQRAAARATGRTDCFRPRGRPRKVNPEEVPPKK